MSDWFNAFSIKNKIFWNNNILTENLRLRIIITSIKISQDIFYIKFEQLDKHKGNKHKTNQTSKELWLLWAAEIIQSQEENKWTKLSGT